MDSSNTSSQPDYRDGLLILIGQQALALDQANGILKQLMSERNMLNSDSVALPSMSLDDTEEPVAS